MRENWNYRRGDIYKANLNPYRGSEQGGTRPVIVLQNNVGNYFSSTLVVAPLTSKVYNKKNIPTHYVIKNVPKLDEESLVLLEQITTIDKERIIEYIGKVPKEDMTGIEEAIKISLGFEIPVEIEAP
ncbi:type II toxin-antitoxin system PemK/MazF family toxin [Anaerofustis stercorihominis]|uniref:type II toxin-antitoxin system PemK/MazF family toxin n=1 Tax=Anaerofustis stercorihominis TaxID=214853 RepID=UPI00210B2C3F|nr:type II toxin-antitoxin system PemK/MazF family toxin [Anaerofustis stercorihominis]